MPWPRSISMRLWLAVAIAGIVSLTAAAVSEVLTVRSQDAFLVRAVDLAAGSAVTAAAQISAAESVAASQAIAARLADQRNVAFFLFDGSGARISDPVSRGVTAGAVEGLRAGVTDAVSGVRLVQVEDGGRRIVVFLPIRRGPARALVAVASRPDLAAAGDIVRGQLWLTGVLAVLAGGIFGTALAFLLTVRIRRIVRAAREIERGRFDEGLRPGFNDELGQLGGAIEGMRLRLRDSFTQLEAERDRFLGFLERLQEGVVAVDRDLLIVFANSQARLQIGRRLLAPGEALPDPWPDASLREFAGSLFSPGAAAPGLRARLASGETYLIAGVPAVHEGQPALIVISDVTLVERRERVEREFVANAAHELRTPIAAIAGAVEALGAGAKDKPELRDRFLGVIGRQSKRLERLIQALLTLARAETRSEEIAFEAIDLGSLLEECADLLRGRDDVVIEVHSPPGIGVWSHRDLLYQAIGNLTENAVKHGDRSPVELAAELTSDGRVRIDVRNRGAGIRDADRERVFDRFYRGRVTTTDGFGLGLAIVGQVVAALRGEVEISPPGGDETVISIIVPATTLAR